MTYACNSRCIFCYNPSRTSPLNVQVVWGVLRSLQKSQIPLVQLIGGEVSLLPELNQFVEFLAPTSNVSVVTNGIVYRELTPNLAGIFISLHGTREMHEHLTQHPGSYDVITDNIARYAAVGHHVHADVIMTSQNYTQLYEIARIARELGMQAIYINRYESGGLGAANSRVLMPTLRQFRVGLDQMIKAREELGIAISFGTATPFCADERLLAAGLEFNCGMASWFAVIGPNGDFRICNQSKRVYGNVLERPLEDLWISPQLDDYRDLRWVTGACASCEVLPVCGAGCRVDTTVEAEYCPDFFVRRAMRPLRNLDKALLDQFGADRSADAVPVETPAVYRRFRVEPFVKVNDQHEEERYIVKRFDTLVSDEVGCELVRMIQSGAVEEGDLVRRCRRKYPQLTEDVIRSMCTQFVGQRVLAVI